VVLALSSHVEEVCNLCKSELVSSPWQVGNAGSHVNVNPGLIHLYTHLHADTLTLWWYCTCKHLHICTLTCTLVHFTNFVFDRVWILHFFCEIKTSYQPSSMIVKWTKVQVKVQMCRCLQVQYHQSVSVSACRCVYKCIRPGFTFTWLPAFPTCHGEETSSDLQRLQTSSTWDESARTTLRYQSFTLEWMARQHPPRQQQKQHRQWQHLPASPVHSVWSTTLKKKTEVEDAALKLLIISCVQYSHFPAKSYTTTYI
jgi:hypothetical protein